MNSKMMQLKLSILFCVCTMSNFWHFWRFAKKAHQHFGYRYINCVCMHRALLSHQPAKFAAARNCIHNNYLFIKSLLAVHQDSQDSPSHLSSANLAAAEHAKRHRQVAPGDMEKVRSAKQ